MLLSQFEPQPREHMRTPSDCVEMMKQAAALMDEDPEIITLDDEIMVMSTSSHEEGAYELFGDFVYDWAIRDGKRFIESLIQTGRDYYLNGIDGMCSSAAFEHIGVREDGNRVLTRDVSWEDWLAKRSSKHRRNIQRNLDDIRKWDLRREHGCAFSGLPSFSHLLNAQVSHLSSKYWCGYGDYSHGKLVRRWPAFVRALASAETLNPSFLIASRPDLGDVAALLTITLGKRRFFIATLMYHDASSVGVCLLSYEMRRSVESPDIDWFDMMSGANHYKRLYEPDRQAPASYRLAIFQKPPGHDPAHVPDSIPMPPFIASGKLYRLVEGPVPEL